MGKKFRKTLSFLLIFTLTLGSLMESLKINVKAAEGVNVILCDDKCNVVKGTSAKLKAMDALKDVLGEPNVITQSTQYGELLTGIKYRADGVETTLSNGKYGSFNSWLYYVVKKDQVINPWDSISDYTLTDGDTLVLYYGDYYKTQYLYSIKYSPEIVKPGEPFTSQYIDKAGNPIQNEEVKMDGKSYVTDNYGKIYVPSLNNGEHSYSLSYKKGTTIPAVIGTSGSFVIDGVHSPNFNYTSSGSIKSEDRDNSGIKVDIASEIGAASPYVKVNGNDSYSAMSMKALGLEGNSSFLKEYKEDIEKYGAADYANTDLETLILGLKALGYSPYSFAGWDLVKTLLNRDINTFQINDLIFALNVYNYVKPTANYKITKDIIIDKIIDKKSAFTDKNYNNIYGFTLAFDKSNPSIDPDITAMAITALAACYSQAKVKTAIDSSINSLKLMENNSGYIIGSYGASAETQSAVIMALTAVGINPRGEDFSKTKGDLITALLSFKGTDGQYKHSLDGKNNSIATEQSLRALISYSNFIKNGFYNYYAGNGSVSLNEYKNLSNKDLPKTGGTLDFSVMMFSGIVVILIGFALINKKLYN